MHNKSKTYLLPLLSTEIEFSIPMVKYLINTFLFVNKVANSSKYKLTLLYSPDFIIHNKFDIYNARFLESNLHLFTTRRVYNSVIDIRAQYCFKIPDVFKKDYDLFVEGRYSEFSQKAKDVILNFSNKFYPHSSQTIQNICKILNKDVSLQESLEKKLGVSSGSIFELSSKVDLVHETYNYTK